MMHVWGVWLFFFFSCDSITGIEGFVEHVNYIVPPATLPSAPYPEWAHYHWVWLSAVQENQASEIALVQGYLDRDVPVGAVNVDSAWQTGDNTFLWQTNLFPNATNMISHFHSQNIRVICWATSLINNDTPNYQVAKSKGYLLNDGQTIKWWHGHGAFIDYSNPDALNWWHSLLDQVLDIGLDGWKTDGTDPFIYLLPIAFGKKGIISEREYADMYYRDFFYYSRQKNPQTLIMARPVDTGLAFAPHDVMFSGWVGDQDPSFEGLQAALTNVIISAWENYLNFGSDTGGYRYGNRTKNLFIRWTQANTFLPLLENGGENEHRPWMYDNTNETLNIYRNFVTFHMDMVPYFLSIGTDAFAKNLSAITPQAPAYEPIETFDWLLGPNVFVAPMLDNSTQRLVKFPQGSDWVDWWNTNTTYKGGTTQSLYVPLDKFPVFRKAGSIIPLHVTTDYSIFGDSRSRNALTILIDHPIQDISQQIRIYEFAGMGLEVSYTFSGVVSAFEFSVTAYNKPIIVMVRGVKLTDSTVLYVVNGEDMVLRNFDTKNEQNCREALYQARNGWCVLDKVLGDILVRVQNISLGMIFKISNVHTM